jgi:hypothetical protein
MKQPQRNAVIEGRVFCRIQGRTVALDICLDCSHIKAMNEHGRSPFIICDSGLRPDDEDSGQRVLNWWLSRSRRPSSTDR